MRALDFAVRLAFFALVPFLATFVSASFPMTGVLVNIGLALAVFAFAEAVRPRAARSRVLGLLLRGHLAFERYYREHAPRPFLHYVFSPLLLPYWLTQRSGRRELWLYSGLTGGGIVVLVVTSALDFERSWLPQLGFARFLPVWLLLFAVHTLCILVFLLPIATTVVKFHLERRFTALWLLLGVAAVSVSIAAVPLAQKRAHIVSWVTTERVQLRTSAAPAAARAAQAAAIRAVWARPDELLASTDARGWVEDDALDRAEAVLETFYKSDEAYAFSLHAMPPEAPEILLLQCHLGRGRQSLWRAIRKSGEEVLSASELPPGVLGLLRRATRRPPSKSRAPFQMAPL
jgi:hypothetical protein